MKKIAATFLMISALSACASWQDPNTNASYNAAPVMVDTNTGAIISPTNGAKLAAFRASIGAPSSTTSLSKTGDVMAAGASIESPDQGSSVGYSSALKFSGYLSGVNYHWTNRLFATDFGDDGIMPELRWGCDTDTLASAAIVLNSRNINGSATNAVAQILNGLGPANSTNAASLQAQINTLFGINATNGPYVASFVTNIYRHVYWAGVGTNVVDILLQAKTDWYGSHQDAWGTRLLLYVMSHGSHYSAQYTCYINADALNQSIYNSAFAIITNYANICGGCGNPFTVSFTNDAIRLKLNTVDNLPSVNQTEWRIISDDSGEFWN